MVYFTCPHCGDHLEADESQDGMTLPCPECRRPIRLKVTHEPHPAVVAGAFLGTGAAILASLFGFDD